MSLKRIRQLLSVMSRTERMVLGVCTLGVVVGFAGLLSQFYFQNTLLTPHEGGTYIEGSVGQLQPLNPWFNVQNDVNRDIVSLVFSGLLRYNPETRNIEEDLATLKQSSDARTYTLSLKDGLEWHDSTEKKRHYVTADDVLFTFQTIQQPGFPNPLLQQNFRRVTISKVDAKTVKFELEEPYSFFPSNLTLGLLPKNAFEGIPVNKLDQMTDFGFKPIGAGPYRLRTIADTELSSEVTLERWKRPIPPESLLERVVFRIFPDYSTLASDFQSLQGIRLVPLSNSGEPILPKRFKPVEYTLPQYVALFFNLNRRSLQDEKLRLGLQLGTDKQAVADEVFEKTIVDTPLLEIDDKDWRYKFDPEAAQGALFASRWSLPEKIRLQKLLERREANRIGGLRANSIVFVQTGGVLTLTGALTEVKPGYNVNGHPLEKVDTMTGGWLTRIPTTGSGTLKMGENLLRLVDDKGKTLDSFYVYRALSLEDYSRAVSELQLVERFVVSRDEPTKIPESQRITSQNLYLEAGRLRVRRANDPVGVRKNDRGEPLNLVLLTSPSPASYKIVAENIAEQWAKLGVSVQVEIPKNREDFQDRLLKRDYDVLLFGESLLDNLDAFPYWHSSGVQKLTGKLTDLRSDAYNLSQYASFKADTLLETIRRTTDDKERQKALEELRDVMKIDVPAIFLYSPTYVFAHKQDILGLHLGNLSLHSDRFLTLPKWYVKQQRIFPEGKSWFSFLPWLFGL